MIPFDTVLIELESFVMTFKSRDCYRKKKKEESEKNRRRKGTEEVEWRESGRKGVEKRTFSFINFHKQHRHLYKSIIL